MDGLGGGDISGFLRHYLLMRHPRVKKSDVFPFFKKDVKKLGPDKTLKELSAMGERYAELLKPPEDEPALYEVLTNLKGTSVDTYRIALLPARAFVDKARFVQFAEVAEILSFRWIVDGGNGRCWILSGGSQHDLLERRGRDRGRRGVPEVQGAFG